MPTTERRKVGVIRDAAGMRVVAVVMELLRSCDADLAALQGDAKSQQQQWDIGSVRARLDQVRTLLVQG